MILELSIGDHVRVLIDDEQPERLTPEQAEDYLTRMRRTALATWNDTTNDIPALAEPGDEP